MLDGLDVAVDDAVTVGVVEGVGHRGDELGRLAERERPVGQAARQRRALDEFLDQVERAVLGLAGLVKGDDARGAGAGRRCGPRARSGPRPRAGQAARPRDLDRDHAPELGVAGPENVAEGAGAEPLRAARTCPGGAGLARTASQAASRRAERSRPDGRDQVARGPAPPRNPPTRSTAAVGRGTGRRSDRAPATARFAVGTALDVARDRANSEPGQGADDEAFEFRARSGQTVASMARPSLRRYDHLVTRRCYTSGPWLSGGPHLIIVGRRVLDHRPFVRVARHELRESADIRRRRATVVHRDVSEPARAGQGGDAAAWDRLVVLYAPLVYRWCRRAGPARAGDRRRLPGRVPGGRDAHRRRSASERAGDTFRGWLRTITRNKVRDHFRKLGREPGGAGGTEAQLLFARLPDPSPMRTTPTRDRQTGASSCGPWS